jgi:hypothetical protein
MKNSITIVLLDLRQLKLVTTNLAVLDGTHGDRLQPCLVFVRGTDHISALHRGLNVKPNNDEPGKSTGTWKGVQQNTVVAIQIDPSKPAERNRKGAKLIECQRILTVKTNDATAVKSQPVDDYSSNCTSYVPCLYDKSERHCLFARWLVTMYNNKSEQQGGALRCVLDVAGGNGALGLALRELGVQSVILLDPNPRCRDVTVPVIAKPLVGDGGDLLTNRAIAAQLETCSLIVGMHPDQATEAIIDAADRMKIPFALLPCCVMPSLFPHRRQKQHGDPVRSYSTFCTYLLDKAPHPGAYQVDYLPFIGRNKIIYSL